MTSDILRRLGISSNPTQPGDPGQSDHGSDVAVIERPPVLEPKRDEEVQQPKMHKVILLNDAITFPDFVVHVLREVFNKDRQQAWDIMMAAHQSTSAVVGIYPKDVAETLLQQALAMAAQHQGDPHRANLRFTSEEE